MKRTESRGMLIADEIMWQASRDRTISVVAEDFRIRAQGSNTFSRGETLRLLGALEYVAERNGNPWHVVPAADPDRALRELVLGTYLKPWREHWPSTETLQHARSALRVIASHLLKAWPDVLAFLLTSRNAALPTMQVDHSLTSGVDVLGTTPLAADRLAPSAVFTFPAGLPARLRRIPPGV